MASATSSYSLRRKSSGNRASLSTHPAQSGGLVDRSCNIASLTDPDFGEQTAQACAKAWFQQLQSLCAAISYLVLNVTMTDEQRRRIVSRLNGRSRVDAFEAAKAVWEDSDERLE